MCGRGEEGRVVGGKFCYEAFGDRCAAVFAQYLRISTPLLPSPMPCSEQEDLR